MLSACTKSSPMSPFTFARGLRLVTRAAHGAVRVEHTAGEFAEHEPRHINYEAEPSGIPNAEGWAQSLASASEAIVKAERAPDMAIEEMQATTIDVIHKVYDRASDEEGRFASDMVDVEQKV